MRNVLSRTAVMISAPRGRPAAQPPYGRKVRRRAHDTSKSQEKGLLSGKLTPGSPHVLPPSGPGGHCGLYSGGAGFYNVLS